MTTVSRCSLAHMIAWAGDGAAHLRGLLSRMGDDAFAAPSALPGWSRAHVLAHVARNGDALVNLLTWARTGERAPVHPSREQQEADIEEGARRPPAEIRDDVMESSDRLAKVVRTMPEAAWAAHVENAQGDLPASDIPWLRARETWIHAVDLDVGASFTDMPAPLVAELLDDATLAMESKPEPPALRLVASDGAGWEVGDQTEATTVTGSAPALAAWLLGRSKGHDLRTSGGARPPAVPRWL